MERGLEGEISRWITQYYHVLAERLECVPKAKSAEQHESAPTSFIAWSQPVWMSACLIVNRTLPAECWICVGPPDFVKAQYGRYVTDWQEWNLNNGYAALKAEF